MARHEARAGFTETLGFGVVAALLGFVYEFVHELGQHQRPFPGLHESAGDLGGSHVRDVVVLGDDGNVFIGKVAVIEAVANR